MSVFLVQKWEDIDNLPFPASTAVTVGDFLKYNGSGAVIRATAGVPLVGVSLQTIVSTDPDYASAKIIYFQKAGSPGQYKFTIPVTAGALSTTNIGQPYNLNAAGTLSTSGAGTQLTIVNVIKATADGSVTPGIAEVTIALPSPTGVTGSTGATGATGATGPTGPTGA